VRKRCGKHILNAKERTQRERKSERKFLHIREREVENRNTIKTKKERKKESEREKRVNKG
jgi:hypothetical protein